MDRWKDRVAVVTGASSGIGEAIARSLAEHGMKVAALARRFDRLQKLQDDCKNYIGSLKSYKCDITNENEINSTIKLIVKDLGPISVLVNNAALYESVPLTDTSHGSCRNTHETNVIGLVTLTQHAVEIMKKHNIDDGHIININSVFGHCILSVVGTGNYFASKHAVLVLTECLKNELAAMKSNIRVTSISPGLVDTEMANIFTHNSVHHYPFLTTNDVLECLLFVLSVKPHVNISELIVQPVGETYATLSSAH
uniref:Putative dehydrogenase n=1 Tax=Triatoma infestans TaxID=30076 RepID=A0A023FB54_TRIIF